jgi:hypothetical protein
VIALQRIGLALLAIVELVIGGWNQFWPRGFYDTFPTVDLDPPFSEHFARDFGGATLGIAAVLIVAFIAPRPTLVGAAALAYSVFAVPHFVFHATHLDHATTTEAVFLTTANAVVALVGVALGVSAVVRLRSERSALSRPVV